MSEWRKNPGTFLRICFFFNDTATTEIYTLSLHDALPICYIDHAAFLGTINPDTNKIPKHLFQGFYWYQDRKSGSAGMPRPISYAVFCLKKKKIIIIKRGPSQAPSMNI